MSRSVAPADPAPAHAGPARLSSPPAGAAARPRRLERLRAAPWTLNLATLAALAAVWLFCALDIRREHDSILRDRTAQGVIQAQAFAEYSRSTIRRVNEYLLDLRSHWTPETAPQFADLVKRRYATVSDISFQVSIIDRDGFLAYSNLAPASDRVDLREREHFRVHAAAPQADRLYISDALKGKVSQKWALQFTRPIFAQGRFAGVIVISVGPEQFAGFWNHLKLAPGSTVTVVKDSGKVIARQPMLADSLGRVLREVPFLPADAPESGSYRMHAQSDGVERVYGYHRMPEYGMTAVVGASVDALLEPYRAYRRTTLRNAMLVTLLLGALYYVVRRSGAAERQAESQRRIAALVYEATSEGMVLTTAEGCILAVNPAFSVVTGYAPEEVIGRTPAVIQSGRHDRRFYAELWRSVQQTGHWQGEIWNRRKNGEIYPQWLTINTTSDADGRTIRRVGLFSDMTEKKKSEEVIWQQANFDALTGLPNRRMFNDRLDQQIKRAHRSGAPFAVLLLDLDRFKEVNDSLGHHAGDQLLAETAARLQACVRETDIVARLGGDEFTVILDEVGEPDAVQRVVDAIHARIATPYQVLGEVVHTSASVGVTLYPRDATDAATLVKQADQAMFAAKAQGPNRCSFFTPAMQHSVDSRLRLIADLKLALAEGQFSLHYQPIVELASERLCKAEALLRWTHPVRGPVSPAEFIPVAEEAGLIAEIGDWVFTQALEHLARWDGRFRSPVQVAVNMSPLQLRGADVAVASWPRRLAERGLPASSLVAEITEGSLMEEQASAAQHLSDLRAAGVLLSLDDFGTGYSSLSYLRRFAIDFLKIDQSFVRTMDADDKTLCEAIIVMARKLGIRVVAEGVETAEQMAFLREAGCDYAQGHFIAPALPLHEFEALRHAMDEPRFDASDSFMATI